MTVNAPPLDQQILDQAGQTVPEWLLWYDAIWRGDAGTDWAPTFVNLTENGGSASITGRYFRLSRYWVLFTVSVALGTATDTSATAGSTYINNFPLDVNGDGPVFAVSNGTGTGSGHVEAATDRIYVPAWTSVTTPLTLIGLAEAT